MIIVIIIIIIIIIKIMKNNSNNNNVAQLNTKIKYVCYIFIPHQFTKI